MGHIELAAPVAHIWYFKGIPTKMGYLLDMSPKELEKVLYFASHIVISVDHEKREADLEKLRQAMEKDIVDMTDSADQRIAELERAAEAGAEVRRVEPLKSRKRIPRPK